MAKLVDIVARAPKTIIAPAKIATAGLETEINFTWRYRSASKLQEWLASAEKRKLKPAAVIMEAAEGWDLEDEFTEKNIEDLLDVFYAYGDIMQGYYDGLRRERIKN